MDKWTYMEKEAKAMADCVIWADQEGEFADAEKTLNMLWGYRHAVGVLFSADSNLYAALDREYNRAHNAFTIPV